MVFYHKIKKTNKRKKKDWNNRHFQHNTDDSGQAMGEESRHAQMSKWSKHTQVKEASSN